LRAGGLLSRRARRRRGRCPPGSGSPTTSATLKPGASESAYLGLGGASKFLASQPHAARILLLEAQNAGAAATSHYNWIRDDAIEWLQAGRELGGVRYPAGFAQAAIPGLAFYLQQCLLDAIRRTPEELVAEAARLLLGAGERRILAHMPLAASTT
jgi:hypothetical protein